MPCNKCDFCPGCKRHCPSCCPRCKYGKKYFCDKKSKEEQPKWAQKLPPESPAWQLLSVCKRAKKALKKEKISEQQLFDAFSAQDMQLFTDLLSRISQNLPATK